MAVYPNDISSGYVQVIESVRTDFESVTARTALAGIRQLEAGGGQRVNVPKDFADGRHPSGEAEGLEQCVIVPTSWRSLSLQANAGQLWLGASRLGPDLAVLGLTEGGRNELVPSGGERLASAFPLKTRGIWCRGVYSGDDADESAVSSIEAQLAVAHRLTIQDVRRRLQSEVGAVAADVNRELQWAFVSRGKRGEPLVLPSWPVLEHAAWGLRSLRGPLGIKRVAMVGCGSMGWAIATGLARSGVTRFTLFDPDKVHKDNLARLDTFMPWAGQPKVAALAEHLRNIGPAVDVREQPWDLGQDLGPEALIEEEPDLIIDAAGETRSTDPTNIAAVALGKPAIYVWVSNGILAARIIRVRPRQSACYECVRESAPKDLPGLPHDDPRSWEGHFFDIQPVAAAVVRLAFRTLLKEPGPEADPDHVVLRFGGVVPTARAISIALDPQCRVCGDD